MKGRGVLYWSVINGDNKRAENLKKNVQGWNNDQWGIAGGVEMIDTVTKLEVRPTG